MYGKKNLDVGQIDNLSLLSLTEDFFYSDAIIKSN